MSLTAPPDSLAGVETRNCWAVPCRSSQGRLAGAVGPDKPGDPACGDPHRAIAERPFPTEALSEAGGLDRCDHATTWSALARSTCAKSEASVSVSIPWARALLIHLSRS